MGNAAIQYSTELLTGLAYGPSISPWTIVVAGGVVGLLVFAFANAFRVILARRQAVRALQERPPRYVRLLRALVWAALFLMLLGALRLMPGRKVVNNQGLLYGDQLFSVMPRTGFLASYPDGKLEVEEGDTLVELKRDAGPDEIVVATNRREILKQELAVIEADALQVDPFVLRQFTVAENNVRDLEQRRRQVVEGMEALGREAPQQRLENATRTRRLDKEIQDLSHTIDQNNTSLTAARKVTRSAQELLDRGLVSADEHSEKLERARVLESRDRELRGRLELLTQERDQLATLTSASSDAYSGQLSRQRSRIAELDRLMVTSRTDLEKAQANVDVDLERARKQRENRLTQIRIQIEELSSFIDNPDSTIAITAPWNAKVGFRDPSPASAAGFNRPLVVLYQDGMIGAQVHVASDTAFQINPDNALVSLRALTPQSINTPFDGKIVERTVLQDGIFQLKIAGAPPAAALKDLAMGATVPVSVIVRRPNMLASLPVGWPLSIVLAILTGIAVSEWRWRQRQKAADSAAELDTDEGPFGFESSTRAPQRDRYQGAADNDFFPESDVGMVDLRSVDDPKSGVGWVLPDRPRESAPSEVEEADLVTSSEPESTPNPSRRSADPLRLLGEDLRRGLAKGRLERKLLRKIEENFRDGGPAAVAPMAMGFGGLADATNLLDASCTSIAQLMASTSNNGQLESTVKEAARFVRVLKILSGPEDRETVDGFRRGLLAALWAAGSAAGRTDQELTHISRRLRDL